jgi:endonuclease YncB( thermonuclease family)
LRIPAALVVAAAAALVWLATAPDPQVTLDRLWSSAVSAIPFGIGSDTAGADAPAALAASTDSEADALVGRVMIVDADTLEIRGTRIRLHAIDAPESSQPCFVGGETIRCGQRAANALDAWIAQRTVRCIGRDIDQYGRTVATCSVGGEDLGRWLVRNGHAVAYRRYGEDYVCDEAAAAAAKRGIWAMVFVQPSEWRRMSDDERRRVPAASYDPGWPAGC